MNAVSNIFGKVSALKNVFKTRFKTNAHKKLKNWYLQKIIEENNFRTKMLIQFSLGLFFFGGLVSANLSGLSSLLNYKNFGKEIVKEALTTFAGNLADEGSGDVCQHFATFLANSLIKKYEKDDGVIFNPTIVS